MCVAVDVSRGTKFLNERDLVSAIISQETLMIDLESRMGRRTVERTLDLTM